MAFNSSEELIVTDYSGDVLVFDKKENKFEASANQSMGLTVSMVWLFQLVSNNTCARYLAILVL